MTDKKLPFHVVFASGEDPQYPASELNVHSSKVRMRVTVCFKISDGDCGLISSIFVCQIPLFVLTVERMDISKVLIRGILQ